jgi:hypothetical protein
MALRACKSSIHGPYFVQFFSTFGVELSSGRHFALISLIVGLLVSPAAGAMLLDYEAYLGGAKVGRAKVEIAVVDTGYEIKGKAESTGIFGFFGKWKSLFTLRGIFSAGKPVTREYEVTEGSGNRKKQISYAGDQVQVRKNGKLRKPMPLPAELDLWSLLFLSEDCGSANRVHNGKDLWLVETVRNELLEGGGRYCEFNLEDEDNEHSVASVWLRQIGDLLVPVRIQFAGELRGTFKLKGHVLD